MLVVIGMLITGIFTLEKFLIIMPFLLFGFCSSLLWLLKHRGDVWMLQEIVMKKMTRLLVSLRRRKTEKKQIEDARR